ncbi:MAG: oligosaccharide flippase family protein [Minisyncoccia bacterium]
MILIPSALISTSFFPALSLAFKESKERLKKAWDYFLESMIFLALPIVVGDITLAPRIIDWIYDPSYFPSILAFQILILTAGISFLSSPFGQILVVANQQKKLFYITLSGAIINVILNAILIPKYSLYGAAATTVVTLLLIFFLLFKFTTKFTSIQPFNLKFLFSFLGAGLSSLVMYFVISQPQIYYLNVILSVLIGAGVYLISFLVYICIKV